MTKVKRYTISCMTCKTSYKQIPGRQEYNEDDTITIWCPTCFEFTTMVVVFKWLRRAHS